MGLFRTARGLVMASVATDMSRIARNSDDPRAIVAAGVLGAIAGRRAIRHLTGEVVDQVDDHRRNRGRRR